MPRPEASAEFYRTLQRLQLVVVAAGRRAWSKMGTDFDRSWATLAPDLLLVVAAGQLAAARAATEYVPAVLAETDQPDEPEARVRPQGFAGVAADGRSLAGLLQGAVVHAKEATRTRVVVDDVDLGELGTAEVRRVVPGLAPEAALALGGRWLDGLLQTTVTDAGRLATAAEITTRDGLGWVRMINPPCCGRCAILAGRWYRWSDGFQRHPRCLPAGVVVSGPQMDAATRRWYDGELVVVRTASGKHLPITGNHPVLTSKGWLPAKLLVEGDDVVRRASGDRAVGLVVPDQDQMPARIEDLWSPDRVGALARVPVAPQDFHGDGTGGEVDVVLADRLLRRHAKSALPDQLAHELLSRRAVPTAALAVARSVDQLGLRHLALPGGFVGGSDLPAEGLLRGVADSRMAGLAPASDRHSGAPQAATHHGAAEAQRAGDGVLALAGKVAAGQRLDIDRQMAPRWDAPAGPMTVQSRAAYASRGQDLLLRLAGQVELDRVVDVARVQWSGHVFNLSSSEGWYDANGLVVSNCDCTHIPASEDRAGDFRTDPDALFDGGLVHGLTRREQERLAAGENPVAVINASRDMWRARQAEQRRADRDAARAAARGETASTATPAERDRQARQGLEDLFASTRSRVDALAAMRTSGFIA